MAITGKPQSSTNIFQNQPKRSINVSETLKVVQDKVRNKSVRVPTRQPVTVTKVTRTPQSHTETTRSQNRSNPRQQRVLVGLWVKPRVREELLRRAETEGISLSSVGSAFLEEALQHSLSARYAPLLEPVIENAIRKQIRAMSTRMAWLLVRVAFDTGQTKTLVTNLLGRQPGVNEEVLKNILARTQQLAKGNITRRTPQLTELMDALKKWLDEEEKG